MNISDLPEFLAVARSGSFTAASASLGVSTAHVSRRVAALEHRLGTRLFTRSTRSVRLTDAGERLARETEAIADQVEAAIQSVSASAQQLEGRLRIAALSGSFADRVVAPAIARFALGNPLVDLDLDVSPRHVDLRREGYDFAIRSGRLSDSGLIARPLAQRIFVAAASPAYLDRYGIPQHPDDLAQHKALVTRDGGWTFRIGDRARTLQVRSRFRANSGAAIRAACEAGLGIAYMASTGYDTAFAQGTLVPILADFWNRETAIHLIFEDRRFISARARIAMQSIEDEAREAQAEDREATQRLADLARSYRAKNGLAESD